jgi:hypothetical protein
LVVLPSALLVLNNFQLLDGLIETLRAHQAGIVADALVSRAFTAAVALTGLGLAADAWRRERARTSRAAVKPSSRRRVGTATDKLSGREWQEQYAQQLLEEAKAKSGGVATQDVEEERRCLQVDPPDYIATGEWRGGPRIPIGTNGRLIIDVTDRPEAKVGMRYNPATGEFETVGPPLQLDVTIVPNVAARATPGAWIMVTNREAEAVRSATFTLIDVLWWDPNISKFAQTDDIHHDGPFIEMETGKVDLFCSKPKDVGFIAGAIGQLGITGTAQRHCDIRTPGIWQLTGRAQTPSGWKGSIIVCFKWDGRSVPKPCDCPAQLLSTTPPIPTGGTFGNNPF